MLNIHIQEAAKFLFEHRLKKSNINNLPKQKKKAKKKKRRISTTHTKITENHHRFVLTPSAKARRGKWSSIGETEERERETIHKKR